MRKPDKQPLIVYVFFGLIGGGKSTLAAAWARRLGIDWFNSDMLRKEMAGPDAGGRGLPFGQGLYAKAFTGKTYQALLDRAAGELSRGRSVVLDGSYRCRADRLAVRDLAENYGARALFILCSCPEVELKKRLRQREADPKAVSDGNWQIYQKQKEIFEEPAELRPEELATLVTLAPVDVLVARLAEELPT
jgi:predicted kinase